MRKNDTRTNHKTRKALPVPLPEKVVQSSVVEIKFLATSWLDDFEKKIFNGKTVNQIINPQRYE